MLKESRNSHVNLKKRKICTVVFYEDLTICIILKNLYHIKNYIELKFCTSYFLLDSGSIVLLHSDSIVSDLKKKTPLFLCESVKRSHYVYGEDLEILTLIKKDKDILLCIEKECCFG